MAGAGKKTFVAGAVLTASDVNTYLMDQAVMRFATASARSTALPTPSEGMMSYLDSTNAVEVYDGASWTSVTGTEIPHAMFATSVAASLPSSPHSPGDGVIGGSPTVTFPAGRFSVAPLVYVTARSEEGGGARTLYTTASANTTASACTVFVTNANSTTQISTARFDLLAVQMTSGSAGG